MDRVKGEEVKRTVNGLIKDTRFAIFLHCLHINVASALAGFNPGRKMQILASQILYTSFRDGRSVAYNIALASEL